LSVGGYFCFTFRFSSLISVVGAVLGIEHDEVEASCAHHLDERRASGEALNAERNLFLLKYR
jgi:hypothetical protein